MQVSVSNLILIPMVFNLAGVLLCRIYYAAREVRLNAYFTAPRIYRCHVCEHVYLEERDVPLSRCTRCGCLNEPVKR